MKRLFLAIAAIVLGATAAAQSTAEKLDALFVPAGGEPYLHGGVLVAENGRVVYHRAFGHADVAERTPNTPESRFQTASLSKVFTSTAVLQLVDKGRLRLDDPVARHLPRFPFKDVTIRHLLAHTSGLPDLELFERLVAGDPSRVIRNSDVIPALAAWKQGLAFSPGTRFRYSNTNYQLLALLVERASGMPFARYLERLIFKPAGMRDTYVLTEDLVPDARRVRNHILPTMYETTPADVTKVSLADAVKMRRIRYETMNLGATLGDQNVISTTLDVFRFVQALGRLLKRPTLAAATSPAPLADGTIRYDEPGPPFATRCSYGLGWEACAEMTGHSGYNRGISTMLYHDPARQQTVVMFDNADGEDFGRKVASVVNVLNGKPPLEVDRRKSLTREYGKTLLERGPAAALIAFNRMRADSAHYVGGSVRGMNLLGYDLLHNGHAAESLEPFRINVVLHPNDANVYDSYGEALAANGKTAEAIAMYERALELNPQSEGAKRALERLRGRGEQTAARVVPFDEETGRAVDTVFAEFRGVKSPGYAVGVVQNGRLVYARGFGAANLDDSIPITPRSVFNVASLSKQFTAAALALLVLDGKVSLADPLGKHIAETPARFREIRLEHLVYMTSGLPEYYRQPRPGGRTWDRDAFTVDDAIAATFAAPQLEFAPGSRWAYSNINYMLLAEVVERVSGEPFAAFLQRRVFGPLKMNDTHVNDDVTRVVPNRVIGYNHREGGGFTRHDRISPHYGGSGVFTTIEDLAKWDRSFETHALGGPKLTALLLSTKKFAHDKANDAFGLVWGQHEGLRTLWYEGGDLGFSSYMVRFPDARLTVIVLSNLGTGRAADKAREVLKVLIRR